MRVIGSVACEYGRRGLDDVCYVYVVEAIVDGSSDSSISAAQREVGGMGSWRRERQRKRSIRGPRGLMHSVVLKHRWGGAGRAAQEWSKPDQAIGERGICVLGVLLGGPAISKRLARVRNGG